MTLIALLDACILYSAPLRDTLLRAAEYGLYRPAFTDEILAEMTAALMHQRPDLEPSRIERIARVLREQFPEALVTGYHDLIDSMTNAVDDRHVLAAAVRGNASVIVTENLRDFPDASCRPYEIQAQTADEFLTYLWLQDSNTMARVLREQAADLTHPPCTVDDLLDILERSARAFTSLAHESGLLIESPASDEC